MIKNVELSQKQLETVLIEIKKVYNFNTTINHNPKLNELEEQLLNYENSLEMELEFINAIYGNHNASKPNANLLVEYGTKLIVDAKMMIDKYKMSYQQIIENIIEKKNEVEQLLKIMQSNPSTKVEQVLLDCLKTFKNYIDKMAIIDSNNKPK